MKKINLIITVIWLGIASALAQEWTSGADDSSEYNCEIVNAIVEDYGAQPYLRRDGEVRTLAELLAEKVPGCGASPAVLHTASTIEGASLYDCADTACNVIEQLNAGDILDITAVGDDWLTVRRGARRLYLRSGELDKLSLEMRIKDTNPTFQLHAGCFITPHLGPGADMVIEIIIAGKRRDQVTVDLQAPGAADVLPIASRVEAKDPHFSFPVITQRYDKNLKLTPGEFILDLDSDARNYRIVWEVTRAGPYRVTFGCE